MKKTLLLIVVLIFVSLLAFTQGVQNNSYMLDSYQGNPFTDPRDGKSYNTIVIGSQCWMAENLAYLPSVSPSDQGSNTTPYYYVYGYQGTDVNAAKATSNYQTYGVLYNWPAVMAGEASSNSVPSGVQGVCPAGWHLPSDEEWKILEGEADSQFGYPDPEWDGEGYRGIDAGGNLKESGFIHWSTPNTRATNSSGFTALPGGSRYRTGLFKRLDSFANYWSSTESNISRAWSRRLFNYTPIVTRRLSFMRHGFYVRCISDCSPQASQSDAGIDQLNIQGTSTNLSANTPTAGQGLWTIVSGAGGSFADSTDPVSVFYGVAGNTYHLVWTISNNCGSSSDTVVVSFASQSFACGTPFTDSRDGNVYNTVQIGSQCWMQENLAYLPSVSPSSAGSVTTPYYYVYDYYGTDVNAAKATNNYQTYGVLYNWPAAMAGQASSDSVPSGVQGICPNGWHLPSDEEWKILEGEVDSLYGYPDPEWDLIVGRGTDAGGNLKETGTAHWTSPNTGATNSSGFTALPGGARYSYGSFSHLSHGADFWSSTEFSSLTAWYRRLYYTKADVYRNDYEKEVGFSVRCCKDSIPTCSPQPTQSSAGCDSLNIQGDSIVLYANTPVNGQGIWTIASGQGGSFADSTDPVSVFYGVAGNTYHLVWTISNNCGSSSDTVVVSFASQAITCGTPFTDSRDGNVYNTVQIGSQCWMQENLAYLPSVSPSSAGSETTPYYYVYDYQGTDTAAAKTTSNYQTYGVLYNWPAAMAGQASSNSVPSGVQGVCPTGWHLPSDEEWKILEGEVDSQYGYPDPEWDGTEFRGTDAGGNLKESGYSHWNSPNTGANNSSGFSALPGGIRNYNGSFQVLSIDVYFWSSTESNSSHAWDRNLYGSSAGVRRHNDLKSDGFSCRCLKDSISPCSPQPTQSNAGLDSLNIQGDSIVLYANTPVNGQGLWTIVNGTGGSFADSTDPVSVFYGVAGNTYHLVWTISNNCGSSSDTVIISFASQAITCGSPFTDSRDGNVYNTVQIGSQCWMQENLAYLPSVSPSSAGSETTPYYYVYDYQGTDTAAAKTTSNYQTYGVLYNWPAAMAGQASSNSVPSGVQGICPVGWHLPSDEEWKILEGEVDSYYSYPDPVWDIAGYRGTDAGGNLKETGTTHWYSPNTGATNSSGFTVLPSGNRFNDGSFGSLGGDADLWSSTEYYFSHAWYRRLSYTHATVRRYSTFSMERGFSVRCLRDSISPCSPHPTQSNAGLDSLNIQGDSIVLYANTPVNGQGLWTILSGAGGSFADSTDPVSVFYGVAGNTYHLVWTISNNCGSSSDTVVISFASQAITCGSPFTDSRDGNVYNTVQIGSQCWMQENLAYLPSVSPSSAGSVTTPYYYVYDYQGTDTAAAKTTSNYQTYGVLYNWPAAMAGQASSNSVPSGSQGICPSGWHLPSDAEWTVLTDHLGGLSVAGGEMKEAGTTHWLSPNTGATNSSGFTALPGGYRFNNGSFNALGYHAYFWSSSEYSSSYAWSRYLYYDSAYVLRQDYTKDYGFSCRCLKD